MLDRIYLFTDGWRHSRLLFGLLGLILAVVAGYLIGKMGVMGGLLVVALPVGIILLLAVLLEPKIGVYLYANFSFLIGTARFMEGDLQVGLGLDGCRCRGSTAMN